MCADEHRPRLDSSLPDRGVMVRQAGTLQRSAPARPPDVRPPPPSPAASGPSATIGPMPGTTRATAASRWALSSPSRDAGRESSSSDPGVASATRRNRPFLVVRRGHDRHLRRRHTQDRAARWRHLAATAGCVEQSNQQWMRHAALALCRSRVICPLDSRNVPPGAPWYNQVRLGGRPHGAVISRGHHAQQGGHMFGRVGLPEILIILVIVVRDLRRQPAAGARARHRQGNSQFQGCSRARAPTTSRNSSAAP